MGFLSKMQPPKKGGFGNAMEEVMEKSPKKGSSKGKKKRALAPRFDLMGK